MQGVNWVLIDLGTYHALYALLHSKLKVFGTHTCMDGCEWHNDKHILTEWGFMNSPTGLIRSINDNGKWSYWIAKVLHYEE